MTDKHYKSDTNNLYDQQYLQPILSLQSPELAAPSPLLLSTPAEIPPPPQLLSTPAEVPPPPQLLLAPAEIPPPQLLLAPAEIPPPQLLLAPAEIPPPQLLLALAEVPPPAPPAPPAPQLLLAPAEVPPPPQLLLAPVELPPLPLDSTNQPFFNTHQQYAPVHAPFDPSVVTARYNPIFAESKKQKPKRKVYVRKDPENKHVKWFINKYGEKKLKKDGKQQWLCLECNELLPTEIPPRKHYFSRQKHPDHYLELPVACDVCPQRFGFHSAKNRHMEMHIAKKNFYCNFCGKDRKNAAHSCTVLKKMRKNNFI